jgi:hypothetical protein
MQDPESGRQAGAKSGGICGFVGWKTANAAE